MQKYPDDMPIDVQMELMYDEIIYGESFCKIKDGVYVRVDPLRVKMINKGKTFVLDENEIFEVPDEKLDKVRITGYVNEVRSQLRVSDIEVDHKQDFGVIEDMRIYSRQIEKKEIIQITETLNNENSLRKIWFKKNPLVQIKKTFKRKLSDSIYHIKFRLKKLVANIRLK